MTAQAAINPISSGTIQAELSGVAPGTDTVPAGSVILARNTGAGVHVITEGIGATLDGMLPGTVPGVATRTISVAAGSVTLIKVPAAYGDANGRVPFGVDGTAAEVKYTIIGVSQ